MNKILVLTILIIITATTFAAAMVAIKTAESDRLKKSEGESLAISADRDLEAKILGMLAAHRDMAFTNLGIKIQHDSIVLNGQVISQRQKDLISRYVSSIEGIAKVVNDMTVVETIAGTETTEGEHTDDRAILALVNRVLQYHCAKYAQTSKINVSSGVVKFSSQTMTLQEKEETGILVSGIKGVKYMIDVDNGDTAYCYAKDPALTQPKFLQQIALTLDWHRGSKILVTEVGQVY